ncbi:hypothetical protein G6321_00026070 [Bradyrhizobium barranii subsp. barranii]|uniref:SGNH/GDSL hydrolase family protein n=1 Tax=Bradyrhizobium barranii subsp. barranii TaxID=2823807 RepID=A0A7Z0TUQ8_9BRAD|nr:hypothetical protein [Bradyrhizobium barranii]UGX98398.1 hypothetical protein G6321_00026070 [Bradyrhizobium barranii subsp. barranii]
MAPIVRRAIGLALFAAIADMMFFGFGLASIARGNPYLLYKPWRLDAEIAAMLPHEREGSFTGWPRQGELPTQPVPKVGTATCGSAWGGSFTQSPDVAAAETWPYLVSQGLGCQIDNHGIGGFSIDQTLLLYREHSRSDSIVILGLIELMLVGAGASSPAFFSLSDDHSPRASLTKPRFVLEKDRLVLIPRPAADVAAIRDAITSDTPAAEWTPLAFPFSFHVATAIYRKLTRTEQFNAASLASPREDMAALRRLGVSLIQTFAREAAVRNNRFVLLLIPSPDIQGELGHSLTMMMEAVGSQPGICIVDPSPELKDAYSRTGMLRTDSGHFSAAGNKALADATLRGLKACGIAT